MKELYRPAFHFTQKAHWMNDPNCMIYADGIYHLFFQYYPGDVVWGPMHWGHASLGLMADEASVELFADDGLTVMTDIFFPNADLNRLTVQSKHGSSIGKLIYRTVKR